QANVDVVVLAVGRAPVAHRRAGDEGAQGAGQRVDVEAGVGGGVALHIDRHRRLVRLQRAVEVDEAGDVAQPLDDRVRQARQLGEVGALDRKLQALAATQIGDADVGDGDAGNVRQPLA